MCGIIAIAGSRPVRGRLIESLRRLEYRGYDSAGVAVVGPDGLQRRRAVGKIAELEATLVADPIDANTGIGHTRWATHGAPNTANAHPHTTDAVAVVHNGIIENFALLRAELAERGRTFASDTDSEVIAHLLQVARDAGQSPDEAFAQSLARLEGAFAIAVIFADQPGVLYGARRGSPLVVGHGDDDVYLGSDGLALAGFTNQVTYLDEGDWVIARPGAVTVYDASGAPVDRPVRTTSASAALVEKGSFRHFMEKEIHEQPGALTHTLTHYLDPVGGRAEAPDGLDFAAMSRLTIVACGTAAYAGAIAKYWFEGLAGLAVDVDVASEFRYRKPVLDPAGAVIAISQSGETADTKAAFELCKDAGMTTCALVNVPESTIARLADVIAPTLAGPEIGVASTKAFTSQLAALACLAVAAARARGRLDDVSEAELVTALLGLPRLMGAAIDAADGPARRLAASFAKVDDVLYLGRGVYFPLALEGALKLKEISYIHAEGYPAGELKHGPIALIDEKTPVVVIAPSGETFEKTASNVQEVVSRGGPVTLITDDAGAASLGDLVAGVMTIEPCDPFIAPIVYAAPIQLLAYYTAVTKGTDVDQPRNLAKSVTVE